MTPQHANAAVTRAADLHLVVTCSNRKTRPVPQELRLQQLRRVAPARRSSAWIARLEQVCVDAVAANELYAGEHWHVARGLPRLAARTGRHASLWICSAGYGLVRADSLLRPYAATFSPRHPDSVGERREELVAWWRELANWPGPSVDNAHSLAELARSDPDAVLLVALSPAYLQACAEDLLEAATELRSPMQLTIVSVGGRSHRDLTPHLVPGDARLQHALGGTRQALNVRVLAYLLTKHAGPFVHPEISHTLATLLAAQPPVPRYGRVGCSDAQVASFVQRRLTAEPDATHSRLLREFRDTGRACEQSRFATVFRTVQEKR